MQVKLELKIVNAETSIRSQMGQINEQINEQIKLSERQRTILALISDNPSITLPQLANELSMSESTIRRELDLLQKDSVISRQGSRKSGRWIVVKN